MRRALAGGGPVLDKPVRRRVQAAIDGLSEQPRPPGVLALQGLRRAYRLRVGDYRVIYTVDDGYKPTARVARRPRGGVVCSTSTTVRRNWPV
ncbi:MAG TPA: type II toxin-antitoxin system RelE/ParE family toxin [Pseudonocardiaceae bacterium]